MESPVTPLPDCYALVRKYADFVREYAIDNGYDLCDYFPYIDAVNRRERLYNDDRVHPTPHGHYYMAKCFLASQGLSIGKERPVPDFMAEWSQKSLTVRHLYAVEWMVLHSWEKEYKDDDEKIAFVKNYFETEKVDGYFEAICKNYLEHKQNEKKTVERIKEIMKKELYK